MARVGINGFGRMGRLVLRAGWGLGGLDFVAIHEPNADAETMALLLEFDSVQGRWDEPCSGSDGVIAVGETPIAFSRKGLPDDLDLVLECSGTRKTRASLEHYRRVLVSNAVKDIEANIVLGVNDHKFDLASEPIVTCASCTTNCLAPVVKVLHDGIGIERGVATTIHDPTNTQNVVDGPHRDPRRARAAQLNLIPTSSNSAYAVTLILPELKGKLTSMAVRAPVLNASLTDCVFQMTRDTTAEEVNALLKAASEQGSLAGILGYEEKPLVSSDYRGDARSGIVDAQSTLVTDKRLVKVLAWYDNEWGYANRLAELAMKMIG
ncbi:MAG: glyceraldehyde 3-phosphate dehydrogenase NAD-binding domain-containing protein [Planctomycetota bacterium]|jgi:glyceraldehyde 3-phosphate dehydrogenase